MAFVMTAASHGAKFASADMGGFGRNMGRVWAGRLLATADPASRPCLEKTAADSLGRCADGPAAGASYPSPMNVTLRVPDSAGSPIAAYGLLIKDFGEPPFCTGNQSVW